MSKLEDKDKFRLLNDFAEWLEENDSFDYHGDMQDFVHQYCSDKWINTKQ